MFYNITIHALALCMFMPDEHQSHYSSPEAGGVECLSDDGRGSCCHNVIQCKLRISSATLYVIIQAKSSAGQ